MPLPKVDFTVDANGLGVLKVDGVAIPGVTAVSIQSAAGETPTAAVELLVGELTVDAEAILTPHILRATREKSRTHSS